MDIPHPLSGSVFDIQPLGVGLTASKTTVLAKSPNLELIRLVVLAGKAVPEHQAKGDITVHCLEGCVDFMVGGTTHRLEAGQLLFVPHGELHSLQGIKDTSLLVTIMIR